MSQNIYPTNIPQVIFVTLALFGPNPQHLTAGAAKLIVHITNPIEFGWHIAFEEAPPAAVFCHTTDTHTHKSSHCTARLYFAHYFPYCACSSCLETNPKAPTLRWSVTDGNVIYCGNDCASASVIWWCITYIYLQCTLNETRLLTAGGTSLDAMHK